LNQYILYCAIYSSSSKPNLNIALVHQLVRAKKLKKKGKIKIKMIYQRLIVLNPKIVH